MSNSLNRAGNKKLKNALWQSSFASIRFHERSRQFYERKRNEGKRHNAAVVALACAARSLLPRLALVRAPLLLIRMATGIMVFLTDSYHVKDAAGNMIVDQVPGAIAGPNVVQHAIDFSLLGWGSVAIAILLFAFTSQVFFFYVATTNLVFLLGEKRNILLGNVVKVGALAISFIGCVITADAMWAAGDTAYGLLARLNMAAVLLLTPKVRKIVNDYDRQRKEGLDLQGYPIGSPRAPMADVSAAAAARIEQALKNLNG